MRTERINGILSFLNKNFLSFLSNNNKWDFTIDFIAKDIESYYPRISCELPKWSTLIPNHDFLYIITNINGFLKNVGRIEKAKDFCSLSVLKEMPEEIFLDVLRTCFHYYLERKKGIFIHASGIKLNNEGFIFTGPAQAGKSTIVRLIKNGQIISDECIMIKKNKSSYYMHSTPFYNKEKNNNVFTKLKSIFFLKKSKKFLIEKISQPEATQFLFSNIWLSGQDKNIVRLNFENILKIINRIPCYHLNFALDNPVESYLNKLI